MCLHVYTYLGDIELFSLCFHQIQNFWNYLFQCNQCPLPKLTCVISQKYPSSHFPSLHPFPLLLLRGSLLLHVHGHCLSGCKSNPTHFPFLRWCVHFQKTHSPMVSSLFLHWFRISLYSKSIATPSPKPQMPAPPLSPTYFFFFLFFFPQDLQQPKLTLNL